MSETRDPVATPEATPAPGAPAAVETPTPTKRELRYKVDHQDRVVDIDAEYADETRRAALAERLRKGEAFDNVTARERNRGQQEVLDVLRQRGYNLVQNAATGEYEVVPPQQSAPIPTAPANVPPPDINELEARVREGDLEAAIELNRATRATASQAKAAVEAREQADRQRAIAAQADAQKRQHFHRAAVAIDEGIAAIGLGSDPYSQGMAKHLRDTAANQIVGGGDIAEAVAAMRQAGTYFTGATKAAQIGAPAAARPASASPPPVVPSPSGAASAPVRAQPKTIRELADSFFTK